MDPPFQFWIRKTKHAMEQTKSVKTVISLHCVTVRNFPFATFRAMTFGERPRRAAEAHLLIFCRQSTQVFGRPCRSTQSVIALRRNFWLERLTEEKECRAWYETRPPGWEPTTANMHNIFTAQILYVHVVFWALLLKEANTILILYWIELGSAENFWIAPRITGEFH